MSKTETGGIVKAMGAITAELRGIRNILSSMWHSRYQNEETDLVSPEVYSDEYISTEECARRLNVTDQTIRNWILQGKKKKDFGWQQGVHYIVMPVGSHKKMIRIPWNQLILSYRKGEDVNLRTFDPINSVDLYSGDSRRNLNHVPDPSVPNVED
ncbi:MAG: hypothetical protein Unbinned3459contig1000_91 [Prokaryotic dsDNA virus sp.]|jgi:hypothetical protein|nr:MAG: hypothetical protein Unbinned3459contig1000_91 [Prokaryotic dsDNA virus sp.]|tara:strand:- start:64078 stop:64542 length:465 start_codon:yes stop_codon:yes gene_type:complete